MRWSARTGEPLQHRDRVNAAAFSPDGARVVTASGRASYAAARALWLRVTGAVRATAATGPRAICTGLASGLVAR
jgi:hypothetical protein